MFIRTHGLSLNVLRKAYSSLCNLGWMGGGLVISLVFWINLYLVKGKTEKWVCGKTEKWVCVHMCSYLFNTPVWSVIYCFVTLFFIDIFCILFFHAGTCLIYFLMFLGKKRLHRTSAWTCWQAVLKYNISLFCKILALGTELHSFFFPASGRGKCAIGYQTYQKY